MTSTVSPARKNPGSHRRKGSGGGGGGRRTEGGEDDVGIKNRGRGIAEEAEDEGVLSPHQILLPPPPPPPQLPLDPRQAKHFCAHEKVSGFDTIFVVAYRRSLLRAAVAANSLAGFGAFEAAQPPPPPPLLAATALPVSPSSSLGESHKKIRNRSFVVVSFW